jgi:metal-responsive CopG/Arc/MetJ family transcriptional regulator
MTKEIKTAPIHVYFTEKEVEAFDQKRNGISRSRAIRQLVKNWVDGEFEIDWK